MISFNVKSLNHILTSGGIKYFNGLLEKNNTDLNFDESSFKKLIEQTNILTFILKNFNIHKNKKLLETINIIIEYDLINQFVELGYNIDLLANNICLIMFKNSKFLLNLLFEYEIKLNYISIFTSIKCNNLDIFKTIMTNFTNKGIIIINMDLLKLLDNLEHITNSKIEWYETLFDYLISIKYDTINMILPHTDINLIKYFIRLENNNSVKFRLDYKKLLLLHDDDLKHLLVILKDNNILKKKINKEFVRSVLMFNRKKSLKFLNKNGLFEQVKINTSNVKLTINIQNKIDRLDDHKFMEFLTKLKDDNLDIHINDDTLLTLIRKNYYFSVEFIMNNFNTKYINFSNPEINEYIKNF